MRLAPSADGPTPEPRPRPTLSATPLSVPGPTCRVPLHPSPQLGSPLSSGPHRPHLWSPPLFDPHLQTLHWSPHSTTAHWPSTNLSPLTLAAPLPTLARSPPHATSSSSRPHPPLLSHHATPMRARTLPPRDGRLGCVPSSPTMMRCCHPLLLNWRRGGRALPNEIAPYRPPLPATSSTLHCRGGAFAA